MHVERFPRFLQQTFRPQRNFFSRIGFEHFRFLIVALLINSRPPKLLHLSRAIPTKGHRTSHARFLLSDWDASGLLASQAMHIIKQMKPGKREVIQLLIDDTRIKKRGKRMGCVSKIWDPKSHAFIHGHIVVLAAIQFRGVTIPWAVDLWVPKASATGGYRKLRAYPKMPDCRRAMRPNCK